MSSSSCAHCQKTSFVIDIHNGDTICTGCGTCQNDIILDQFGNPPPDHRTTLSIDLNTHNKDRDTNTDNVAAYHKRLELFYDIYDIPEAMQEYGHVLLRYAEQHKISLSGNKKDYTCLAILYLIHDNFGILWDIEAVCKDFKIKSKKIMGIANNFNMSANSTNANENLKTQVNIFKTAMQMEISTKNIIMNDIYAVCDLSKSTKMKTALALYIAAPSRINDIINNMCVQKSQLLKAKAELDALQ